MAKQSDVTSGSFHTQRNLFIFIFLFYFFFPFLFLICLTLISSFWIVILSFFVQFFAPFIYVWCRDDLINMMSCCVQFEANFARTKWNRIRSIWHKWRFFPFSWLLLCFTVFFTKNCLSFCHQCECVCPFACKWVRVRLRRIYFFVVLVLFPPPSVWPVTPAVLPMRHIALDRKLDLFVRLFFFNFKNKKQLIVECQLGCIIFHCVGIPVL